MIHSQRARCLDTVVLSANSAWNIANFRLGIITALIDAGYKVVVLAPHDAHVGRILETGAQFIPIAINRKGMNPIEDLKLYRHYRSVLAKINPVAYLSWTIKPNIFGCSACRQLGISAIPNIAGLGFAFSRETLLTFVVRMLYKYALSKAQLVFFQNNEDLRMFVDAGVVREKLTARLPGSGVDVMLFRPQPLPPMQGRSFRVLMCARLLKEKGFSDLAEATSLLKARGRAIDVRLLGPYDNGNPTALRPAEIDAWVQEGLVTYLGEVQNIRPHLADVDAVVLPSYYREGLPRVLLEAASMAKPIVTTDSVGCREAIVDQVTGLLCRVRDPSDLAAKLERLMSMPSEQREAMGATGRERILREFDERIVAERYVQAVTEAASHQAGGIR